jgi:predicted negative regulator of RcsB-dependent stress response
MFLAAKTRDVFALTVVEGFVKRMSHLLEGKAESMPAEKITRKKLLKSEDEFLTLSARAVLFVRDHSRQFQYLGIALVVLLLIYLGIHTYLRHVEKKGQMAYNDAYYALAEVSRGKPDPERVKKLEGLFKKVAEEYGLAKVSRLAYPELGLLQFQEKKYDEAISFYSRFLKEVPQPGPYASLTLLALAASHEEKKEMGKAAEQLKKVIADPQDPFREQAVFHLARIYRLNQQHDLARETLKEFVARYTDSPFLPMAKAFLKGYPSE